MKIKWLLCLFIIYNNGICQDVDGYVLLTKIIDDYHNVEKLKCPIIDSKDGYIIRFTKIYQQNVQVSMSSIYFFDEVINNCDAVFQYKNRMYYLQFESDSMFYGINLKLVGCSNKHCIDSIAMSYLNDSRKGDYVIYYPFISVFHIKKIHKHYKAFIKIYFPEATCPKPESVKRKYYPPGTKYYPQMESLSKKFKHRIAKIRHLNF